MKWKLVFYLSNLNFILIQTEIIILIRFLFLSFFRLQIIFLESAYFDQVVMQAQAQVQENVVAEDAETAAGYVQRLSATSLRNSNNGPVFVVSKYGTKQLLLKQHTFNRHVTREDVTYWRCSQFAVLRCRARIKTKSNILTVLNSEHNHEVITKTRRYGSLKSLKAEQNAKKDSKEKADDKEDEFVCN